jgi:tRNA A37 threonylcarbamoyladenosine synthetase subunit TsaC/SUA5/YrdC
VAQAQGQLGDLVDVYLDGGPSQQQAASTILDLTGPAPRILREGPVSAQAIADVLGVDPATLVH